jgi:soluble lytic murein transglycosylase-like protein
MAMKRANLVATPFRLFDILALSAFVLLASLSIPKEVRDAHGAAPSYVALHKQTARVAPVRGHRRYDGIILEYATRYRVDPALVKAVIHVESRFQRRARSRRGAKGLMQLMPRTGRAYGARDLYDARHNIRAGTNYLRSLIRRYRNDLRLAVAAYNAGARKVDLHRGVPPYRETRQFVTKVLHYHQHYRRTYAMQVASRS